MADPLPLERYVIVERPLVYEIVQETYNLEIFKLIIGLVLKLTTFSVLVYEHN